MNKIVKSLLVGSVILGTVFVNESNATMRDKIARHLAQIQQNCPGLEGIIKNIVTNNNEKYQNDPAKRLTLPASMPQIQLISAPEGIKEIVDNDNLDKLQTLINQKCIQSLQPIKAKFLDIKKIPIPLIHYCVIEKAKRCFKYLLINGIEDPTKTMMDTRSRKYQWDCMATAIFYGELEIVKILEESGIEKGSNPGHLEAAILSYRNSIAKEIIIKLKDKEASNLQDILTAGLNAAAQSNNIKGYELLISQGAKINAEDRLGWTPLHIAAEYNSKEIGELLISKGADINAKDKFGLAALDYAIRHFYTQGSSKEMEELLLSIKGPIE